MKKGRILGELIKAGQEKGEIKTQATAKSTTAREVDEIGLTHKQSSAFQQIASIPEVSSTAPVRFSDPTFTGPGVRKVTIRHYSDGRVEVVRDSFKPDRPPPADLKSIWTIVDGLTFDHVRDELERQGITVDGTWTAPGIAVGCLYRLLHARGILPKLNRDYILRAFKGSFDLSTINVGRCIGKRGKQNKQSDDEYKQNQQIRRWEKHFREILRI